MTCPHCHNQNCQVVTETSSTTRGYGLGKGCLGALCIGPWGWLCGLCGMGKGHSSSVTYWICNACGHKFRA